MSSSCIYKTLKNIFLFLESDHGPGYSNFHWICQRVESHPTNSRLERLTSNERGEHIASHLAFAMQAEIRVVVNPGRNRCRPELATWDLLPPLPARHSPFLYCFTKLLQLQHYQIWRGVFNTRCTGAATTRTFCRTLCSLKYYFKSEKVEAIFIRP